MHYQEKVDSILGEITSELSKATETFSPFTSLHQGYAVIKEEVDELWDIVKRKEDTHNIISLRKEAIQVAAMAVRFVLDLCDKD